MALSGVSVRRVQSRNFSSTSSRVNGFRGPPRYCSADRPRIIRPSLSCTSMMLTILSLPRASIAGSITASTRSIISCTRGALDKFIGELPDPGLAADDHAGHLERHAKFTLEARPGFFVPQRALGRQNIGTGGHLDVGHILGLHPMFAHQGLHRIHGRVSHHPAGVRFDGNPRVEDRKRPAQLPPDFVRIEPPGKGVEESFVAFQCIRMTLISRRQPVGRKRFRFPRRAPCAGA